MDHWKTNLNKRHFCSGLTCLQSHHVPAPCSQARLRKKKYHKFTTNMTFLENKMSWMIFHPSKLLTYLLYRFLEPPENQLAETTNIPKKGGMFFFPLMLNFRGVCLGKCSIGHSTFMFIPNLGKIPSTYSSGLKPPPHLNNTMIQ